jgi:hypothetical protein
VSGAAPQLKKPGDRTQRDSFPAASLMSGALILRSQPYRTIDKYVVPLRSHSGPTCSPQGRGVAISVGVIPIKVRCVSQRGGSLSVLRHPYRTGLGVGVRRDLVNLAKTWRRPPIPRPLTLVRILVLYGSTVGLAWLLLHLL